MRGGPPPGVVASGFGWTYASRSRPALRELSFTLPPGCVLLVLGPSGCGKSTLARALAGLVPHVLPGTWHGRLNIGELDVAATPAARLGARVGLVFQDPDSQLVMARVEDEVAFGLENLGWPRPAMVRRVPESLAEAGLAGFERRGTATLSGGEKQRLAIADVLAPAPGLLVFDEPTANLDPPGMHATFERLSALAQRREHTMVVVEHRLDAALPLADRVLVLGDDGRQIAFGPPDEVGRRHAGTLARLGGWVPTRWLAGLSPSDPTQVSDPPGNAPAPPSPPGDPTYPVLSADGVTVSYPLDAAGARPPAVAGVDFRLAPGERVALVGPNGSGKSTLLFALAGLRRPDAGRIRLGPGPAEPTADPSRLPARRLAELIGVVFQDPELGFVGRTVAAEVAASIAAPGRGSQPPADGHRDEVTALLQRFGLAGLADADPFRLSQGEQRRLSLAAVSLRPPRILLLDEPTFGLDRRGTDAVMDLLDDLRADGQAQVLATHDPRLLARCDRVVALDAGVAVFRGTPAEFRAQPPYRPPAPWQAAPVIMSAA